jgi:hypothetical protein
MREGDPCYTCSTPLIEQKSRRKPKGGHYFEYYLWCAKCQATCAGGLLSSRLRCFEQRLWRLWFLNCLFVLDRTEQAQLVGQPAVITSVVGI